MPKKFISMDRFFDEFLYSKEDGPITFDQQEPPYMLILGAGASRSAGIPLAAEMERMLATFATWAGTTVPQRPKSTTTLSWYFDRLLPLLPWRAEDSDVKYRYEFIRKCIGRANAEPNLTHLLAAIFTASGLFGPIVTTNFDDQALAGFWHLPLGNSYTEPHVIYDPRSASSIRILPEIPVIIKAHGHHTIWGTGVLDKEIKELSPHVERLLNDTIELREEPPKGFLVVGYSGFWNDGVVRFLKRRWAAPIYWCYCGKRPSNPNIERISRINDVRFVRIPESDALFLSLWQQVYSQENAFLKRRLFEHYHLFNVQRRFPAHPPWRPVTWWPIPSLSGDEAAIRNLPQLVELRAAVIPVLQEIEAEDMEAMFYECLLGSFILECRRTRSACFSGRNYVE
jgi:hypothetical protein